MGEQDQVQPPELVRLSEHPILEKTAPYFNFQVYDRDGGTSSPRIRIEFRSKGTPPEIIDEVLKVQTACVRCKKPIFSFRKRAEKEGGAGRVKGLNGGIYVAVSCPRKVNAGCCNGAEADLEYVDIRNRVCGILGVDPAEYSTKRRSTGRSRSKKTTHEEAEPLPFNMDPSDVQKDCRTCEEPDKPLACRGCGADEVEPDSTALGGNRTTILQGPPGCRVDVDTDSLPASYGSSEPCGNPFPGDPVEGGFVWPTCPKCISHTGWDVDNTGPTSIMVCKACKWRGSPIDVRACRRVPAGRAVWCRKCSYYNRPDDATPCDKCVVWCVREFAFSNATPTAWNKHSSAPSDAPYKCSMGTCANPVAHGEHFYDKIRWWCDAHVPMSGHYEDCPEPCKTILLKHGIFPTAACHQEQRGPAAASPPGRLPMSHWEKLIVKAAEEEQKEEQSKDAPSQAHDGADASPDPRPAPAQPDAPQWGGNCEKCEVARSAKECLRAQLDECHAPDYKHFRPRAASDPVEEKCPDCVRWDSSRKVCSFGLDKHAGPPPSCKLFHPAYPKGSKELLWCPRCAFQRVPAELPPCCQCARFEGPEPNMPSKFMEKEETMSDPPRIRVSMSTDPNTVQVTPNGEVICRCPDCDETFTRDRGSFPFQVPVHSAPEALPTTIHPPRCGSYYRIQDRPALTPMHCNLEVGHLGMHQYRDPDDSLIMEWADSDPNCGTIPWSEQEAVLDFLRQYRQIMKPLQLPAVGSRWVNKTIRANGGQIFMNATEQGCRVVNATGPTVKIMRFPAQVVIIYPRKGGGEYEHTMSLEQFNEVFGPDKKP